MCKWVKCPVVGAKLKANVPPLAHTEKSSYCNEKVSFAHIILFVVCLHFYLSPH